MLLGSLELNYSARQDCVKLLPIRPCHCPWPKPARGSALCPTRLIERILVRRQNLSATVVGGDHTFHSHGWCDNEPEWERITLRSSKACVVPSRQSLRLTQWMCAAPCRAMLTMPGTVSDSELVNPCIRNVRKYAFPSRSGCMCNDAIEARKIDLLA